MFYQNYIRKFQPSLFPSYFTGSFGDLLSANSFDTNTSDGNITLFCPSSTLDSFYWFQTLIPSILLPNIMSYPIASKEKCLKMKSICLILCYMLLLYPKWHWIFILSSASLLTHVTHFSESSPGWINPAVCRCLFFLFAFWPNYP